MAERRGSVGRITCLGEALIDFLPIDEEGRTVGFRMHPDVDVVDTVGAGDALTAGLLSWLRQRGVTSRVSPIHAL